MTPLSPEADAVLSRLAAIGSAKPAMKSKLAQEILTYTEGWMMAAGRAYDIKSRSLGAGIWQLWLEPQP